MTDINQTHPGPGGHAWTPDPTPTRADAFTLVREALALQHQAGYLLGRTISTEASQEAIDRAAATRRECDAKTVEAWRALYDQVGDLAARIGELEL